MKLHNELPSVVLTYKHYDSEVISGVLEKVVTPDDLDSEDYPCGATMLLWIQWLQKNLERIEGYLRAVAYELSDYYSRFLPGHHCSHPSENQTDDGWNRSSGRSTTVVGF